MPRIYITEPNHFYTFELPTAPGAEVLIGTAPQCQLALPGVAGLGPVHACISCQPQGYVVADMGSPTGTFANGVPIQSEYLMPGVEYRMGAAVITLAAEGMPPQQQPMGMPQQQPMPQQQAAPTAAPQQQPKKKASPLKTGAAAAKSAGKAPGKGAKLDLASKAARFDRSRGGAASKANFIYVVVMLVIAFYAGIALHHWERTGNCLPGLVQDEQDPPAAVAKPAATAPAAESADDTASADPEPQDTATTADPEPVDEPSADADDAGMTPDTAEDVAPGADEEPAAGEDDMSASADDES